MALPWPSRIRVNGPVLTHVSPCDTGRLWTVWQSGCENAQRMAIAIGKSESTSERWGSMPLEDRPAGAQIQCPSYSATQGCRGTSRGLESRRECPFDHDTPHSQQGVCSRVSRGMGGGRAELTSPGLCLRRIPGPRVQNCHATRLCLLGPPIDRPTDG